MNKIEAKSISFSSEEEDLQLFQTWAWRGKWAEKEWWTPVPYDFLRRALNESRTRRLLVVACGSGRRELLYAESIGWQAFAFDVNEAMIKEASGVRKRSSLPLSRRTSLFVGDLLDLPLKADDNHFATRGFTAALMVGIATNLIGRNLDRAIEAIRPNIQSGGFLIISDFMISLEGRSPIEMITGERGRRYLRDAAALHILTGSLPWEVENELQGVIVIRPRGLSWREALSLTSEEVAEAMREGDFQHLAQHRSLTDFQRSLERVGFKVRDHNLGITCPIESQGRLKD